MPHRRVMIDLPDGAVENMKIGDNVRVTLEGKVNELEGERVIDYGPEGSDTETIPPRMEMEVSSVKVSMQSNAFTDLAEGEMGDD